MPDALELSSKELTSRERSRLSLYRIADTLGCRPERILDAAGSETFPDETAEMVRLWFRLRSDEARTRLLEHGRSMVAKKRR